MFTLFSRLFWPFLKFGFFSKMGRQTLRQSIILYNLGQHALDSKFFSFLKQFPEVFHHPILVINLTIKNLFWSITELNPRNLQLLKIFTPKMGNSCCKFQTKNDFQGKFGIPKSGMHTVHKNGKSSPPFPSPPLPSPPLPSPPLPSPPLPSPPLPSLGLLQVE